jgi:hypothetical protein
MPAGGVTIRVLLSKREKSMKGVTPAEAGVQKSLETLDSRLRGNDEKAAVRRPKIPLPLPFVPSRKGRGDELWESLKKAFSDFLGGPQRWGGVRRFRDE